MPDKITVDFGFLASRTTFIPDHAGPIDTNVFQTVFTALQTSNTVSFEYRGLHDKDYVFRIVDPYHAICQKGHWYIIGFCHDKKAPRLFSLSRIKRPRLGKQHFQIPADFNPLDYFDKEMGVWATSKTPFKVELLFMGEAANFALEQHWHEGQEVRQNDDGTVYVSFTTTQMPEVLRWVLGQGETVKVLNPPELIGKVREQAAKIAGLYEKN
jgi:predicted DNA-binding transcriptional regulator YafY